MLGYIEIDVVGDDNPELDEMFRCTLKSTDGQGVIDETRNTVTFTIKWVFLLMDYENALFPIQSPELNMGIFFS